MAVRRHLQPFVRMNKLFLVVAVVLVPACPSFGQAAFVVKKFERGPLCRVGDAKFRVCANAEEVQITGDSECTYDGKVERCTWYGFSFEYEPRVVETRLSCSWSSSEGARPGNPVGASANVVNEGQYELVLRPGTTRFINPQYAVLPRSAELVARSMKFDQRCTHRGQTVFEFSLNLHFPRNRPSDAQIDISSATPRQP